MKTVQVGPAKAQTRKFLGFAIPTRKPVYSQHELGDIVANVYLDSDLAISTADALWLTTPGNQARATDEHGNEFQLISRLDLIGNLTVNIVSLQITVK